MARQIRKVVVLGANGAMGAGSGEVFAAAGIETTFLARTRDKALEGQRRAEKLAKSTAISRFIRTGSYDEDLARAVAEADLVFEAVVGGSGAQARLLRAGRRRCASPTRSWRRSSSGLSIAAMAARRRRRASRSHFLGIHFFNPPNVIVGCELIPHAGTDPRVVADVDELLDRAARARAGAHQRHAGVLPATASASRCSTSARSSPRSTAPRTSTRSSGRTPGARWRRWRRSTSSAGTCTRRSSTTSSPTRSDEAHDAFALPAYMKRGSPPAASATRRPTRAASSRKGDDASQAATPRREVPAGRAQDEGAASRRPLPAGVRRASPRRPAPTPS